MKKVVLFLQNKYRALFSGSHTPAPNPAPEPPLSTVLSPSLTGEGRGGASIADITQRLSTLLSPSLTGEGRGGASIAMTATPTPAELAAAALLDSMSRPGSKVQGSRFKNAVPSPSPSPSLTGEGLGGASPSSYYTAMASRIRDARAMEERACLRWLTYCEQQLTLPAIAKSPALTGEGLGEGLLAALERGLYDRQDIAYRAGGTLLRRWQHCLAEVTIRLMNIDSADSSAEIEQN